MNNIYPFEGFSWPIIFVKIYSLTGSNDFVQLMKQISLYSIKLLLMYTFVEISINLNHAQVHLD